MRSQFPLFFIVCFVLANSFGCKTINNQFRDVKFECGEDAVEQKQYVKLKSPRGEDLNPREVTAQRLYKDRSSSSEVVSVTSKGCIDSTGGDLLLVTAKGAGYSWGEVIEGGSRSEIALRDIAKWDPKVQCPVNNVTSSSIDVPLVWDKSLLKSLPVDIFQRKPTEQKIQEHWIQPSLDLSFLVSEGPFAITFRWQDPFDGNKNFEHTCEYIMDRISPVLSDNLPLLTDQSDIQIQAGQIITLKSSDERPAKIEYCFHKKNEDCTFIISPVETSFYAPDKGHWCLKYRSTDVAGNQSRTTEKCGLSIDFSKINEIKALLSASMAKDAAHPFLSLVNLSQAFLKYWSLETDEEKSLVDEELIGATWNTALNNKIVGQYYSEYSWQLIEVGDIWAKRLTDRIIFRNVYGKNLAEYMLGEADNLTAYSATSNRVALPLKSGVELFEARGESILRNTIITPMEVFGTYLSPHANYLIATGKGLAVLYDLTEFSSPKEIWRLNVKEPTQDVVWSYENDFFGINDEFVRVFSLSPSKAVHEIQGFQDIERARLIIGKHDSASLVYEKEDHLVAKNLHSLQEYEVMYYSRVVPVWAELISSDEFTFVTKEPRIIKFDEINNRFTAVEAETGLNPAEVVEVRWHKTDRSFTVRTKNKIFLFNANPQLHQNSYSESYPLDSFDANPGDRLTEYGNRYFHINGITGIESGSVVKLWSYQPIVGQILRSDIPRKSLYPFAADIRSGTSYSDYDFDQFPLNGQSRDDFDLYSVKSYGDNDFLLPKKNGEFEILLNKKRFLWSDNNFEVVRTFMGGLIVKEKGRSELEYWQPKNGVFEKCCGLEQFLGINADDYKLLLYSSRVDQVILVDRNSDFYLLRPKGGKFEILFEQKNNDMPLSAGWEYQRRQVILSQTETKPGVVLQFDDSFKKILKTSDFLSKYLYAFDMAAQGGFWGKSFGLNRVDKDIKQRFTINFNYPGLDIFIAHIPASGKYLGLSSNLSHANAVIVPVDIQLPLELDQLYLELCQKIGPSLKGENLIQEAKSIVDTYSELCKPR